MEKIVLIPAYKPDEHLTDLARTLCDKGLTLVVVDDGSGADYQPLFAALPTGVRLVSCPQNGGKGAAIKRGLAYIRDAFTPPYCVTTADADGQHRVEDILRVADAAAENPGALVIGCRSLKNMPAKNWWGNMYTKVAFLFSTGKFVHDTQTGLRGFSHTAIPFLLDTAGDRYEYEMRVLLHWARLDLPVVELPIETVYIDGNSRSHFRALWDSLRIYREILRISAPFFACFLLDVALFLLLQWTLPDLPYGWVLANAAARIVTAALYYALTRRMTKHYHSFSKLSVAKFLPVALAGLVLNTLAVWGLTCLGIPLPWVKVLANIALFFVGFIPQRKLIFRNKE